MKLRQSHRPGQARAGAFARQSPDVMVGILRPVPDRREGALLVAIDEDADAELGCEMRRQRPQQRQRKVEVVEAAQGDVLAEGQERPAADAVGAVARKAGVEVGGRLRKRLRQRLDQRVADLQRALHQLQRLQPVTRKRHEPLAVETGGVAFERIGDGDDDTGVQQILQWFGHRSGSPLLVQFRAGQILWPPLKCCTSITALIVAA